MINRQTEPYNNICFLIAWTLFTFSLVFSTTIIAVRSDWISTFLKLARYVAYILCIFQILNNRLSLKGVIAGILLFAVFSLNVVKGGSKTLVLYSLVLIAASGISSKRILRISVIIQAAIITLMIVLSRIGILEDYIFAHGEGERIRHCLGFGWATTAPILYFYFLLVFIYLKNGEINWCEAIVMEGVNIWLFFMTNTRMSFALSSCFIIFFLLNSPSKMAHNRRRFIDYLYILSPFIIFFVVLIAQARFNPANGIWGKIDNLLSGRLTLGRKALADYGINAFGHDIEWVGFNVANPILDSGKEYNYVDCSYLQLLLEYGAVAMLGILCLYSVILSKAIRKNDYLLVYMVIIVLIFAITEPRLMNFAFNPFPVLAFTDIREENSQNYRLKPNKNYQNVLCGVEHTSSC